MKNTFGMALFILAFSLRTFAADFEVLSNPVDADVFLISEDGKKTALGKTPYKADGDSLKNSHGSSGSINISVAKSGFLPFSIVVPMITKTAVKINASLEIEKDIKLTQDFDLLTSDLFDALRMMRGKDYKSAYAKLELLEKKFPHFSIIYEMKGAILYLQNEYKMSLNFYRKAFGVNPQNREAYKMKTYLEKKFGLEEHVEIAKGNN